jgi:hypothetical protein
MIAVDPHTPIFDLLSYMQRLSQARARQVAGVLDVWLHLLPPKERAPALHKLLAIWIEHHAIWAGRIDAAVAMDIERDLSSFDWSETEAALRTLARDLEGGER